MYLSRLYLFVVQKYGWTASQVGLHRQIYRTKFNFEIHIF